MRRVAFPAARGAPLLKGTLHLPTAPASGSADDRRCPAAVVCHPHSLMGGSMDNGVVLAVCEALAARGVIALRFNFRGVGGSEGTFGGGEGEVDDVAGAVDFLVAQEEVDPHRLAVVGYSFGAGVGLHYAVRDPRLGRMVAIAPIREQIPQIALEADPRPKLFIAGEADPFAPADMLRAVVAQLAPPKSLHILPQADHFFAGQERTVATLVANSLAVWR